MKKIVLKIIGQILSISIFVGVFLFSLFITYGYRYDFQEKTVVQTSVIDICTSPKQADLYLDNELYSNRSCEKIFGIDVGAHKLEVKKYGYHTWTKNIYSDNENVSLYQKVLLIPYPEFYKTTILEKGISEVWVSPNQSRYAVYNSSLDAIKVFAASRLAPTILEAPASIKEVIWADNNKLVVDTVIGRYEVNINKGDWRLVEQVAFHSSDIENDFIVDGGELRCNTFRHLGHCS